MFLKRVLYCHSNPIAFAAVTQSGLQAAQIQFIQTREEDVSLQLPQHGVGQEVKTRGGLAARFFAFKVLFRPSNFGQ